MAFTTLVLVAASALIVLAVPLVIGLLGVMSERSGSATRTTAVSWQLTMLSALNYALAFNLTFFIQEFFLVLPKAFTTGLRPTLYHNDHSWEGTNPLAELFQGTGALATLMVGLICMFWLPRSSIRSNGGRLFLFWMSYCGCLMALPQVVIGALSPGSDLGRAMQYLHWGDTARLCAGLLTLVLMPVIAFYLCRTAVELVSSPDQIAGPGGRARLVLWQMTLPALIGTLLVIPFRVPRDLVEVLVVPLIVILAGIPWIQACAWRIRTATPRGTASRTLLVYPLAALVMMLLVFQFVLRPGIHFY